LDLAKVESTVDRIMNSMFDRSGQATPATIRIC
jgi:hypothetical protein